MDFRPHKTDGWLSSPDRHDPAFDERVARINELYRQARRLRDAGVRVVSTDEKTGTHALTCAAPTPPTRCGDVEKREFEYVRHGTGTLIATLDVATGSVITGSLGSPEPKRTSSRTFEPRSPQTPTPRGSSSPTSSTRTSLRGWSPRWPSSAASKEILA